MKTIELTYPITPLSIPESAVALGFFDGVHLGHRDVIATAVKEAKRLSVKSSVMTFNPHPKEVLSSQNEKIEYLTLLSEKQKLIEELGVDFFFVISFNKTFSELTPQQFIDQFIIGLNIKHVVAGFDYSYGRLGKGKMETFPFHSRGLLASTTVSKRSSNDEKISSTAIREALHQGLVEKATSFLGRYYSISGTVVKGEQRGRTIGFPTANIKTPKRRITPFKGVYAVYLKTKNEKVYKGVCNIGHKPTFHDEWEKTVEVHLMDQSVDLYDQEVTVYFVKRIRDEMKFSSVDELIKAINTDIEQAYKIFDTSDSTCFPL